MIGALMSIVLLLGLLILGVPMLVSLLAAVVLNFFLSGSWTLILPQSMISGISSFTLIALPLFVLAGTIMNAGGISGRLFDFAKALVGWARGGLAQVDVLISLFFGGMIGSSSADLAGTGSITIPALKRDGYPADIAASITASSSGIGPMIPPSSPMILYSAITGVSLGSLFIATLIPGILLGLVLMGVVAILAHRRQWPRYGRLSLCEIWVSGRRSLLSFGMPALIIGGLVLGVFTPTEGAAFAVVYALVLTCFIYRTLRPADLFRVFGNAVQMTGELLVIVSLSFALGASLSSAHAPQALADVITGLVGENSPFLQLLALVVLGIIAGMFLDPLIPVLIPIVLPLLTLYQIDVVHFAVVTVVCVVIGQLTPPVAIALIITSRIADCDQMKIFRANLPFLLAMVAFLIVLMLVPELATWLPNQVDM